MKPVAFKVLLSLFLLSSLLLSLLACTAEEAISVSGPESGSIGDIRWSIKGGILTLDGSGPMPKSQNNESPWKGRRSIIKKIVFSGEITSIGAFAFYECSALTEVILPDTLTSIGEAAFYGCRSLTQIRIPDKVEYLGEYAFAYCLSLESIILGASLQTIDHYAFSNAESLRSLTIPPAVSSIGLCITSNASSLEQIKVIAANPNYTDGGGNCIIDKRTSALVTGCKTTVIPTDGSVTEIATGAFDWCTGLTDIVIPDSVTTIREWAFSACSSLKSVTLGKGLTTLEFEAFSSCEKLKTIYNRSSLFLTRGSEDNGGVALYATTIKNES